MRDKFRLLMQKKAYFEDMALNLLATALPILTLQFMVLPGVNSVIGEESYGLVVTIVSVLTYITSTSAGTLNNVRLIMDEQYTEKKYVGDFNIIQLVFSVINVVLVIVICAFYMGRVDSIQYIFLGIATLLICADGYYSVGFRLQINYRRILVQKVLLAIGYIIGYGLFLITEQWIYIYIVGYALDLSYIIIRTDLIYEKWRLTPLYRITLKEESILIIAQLIGGLSQYIDKLILYPLYGGIITTTYYVASLMGKGIAMLTFPISGVLLSYFSKIKRISSNSVKTMSLFGWIAGVIGYVLCLIISKPILTLLYPDVVGEAMRYVPVMLFSAVIGVQITLMNPVILKFCERKWQILISVVNILCYLVISLVLLKFWGLMGFCIGGVITSIIKYVMYIMIYRKNANKVDNN